MRTDEASAWFGAWLAESGYRPSTIGGKLSGLKVFLSYLSGQGVTDLRAVDRACMEDFARYLRQAEGERTHKPYRPLTRRSLWHAASGLMAALYEAERIPANPVPRGMMKDRVEALPTLLTAHEVASFLDGIDTASAYGRRDRALFELIYSSGLRGSEASGVRVGDLDLEARLMRVRMSKFDRERVVPLTREAVEALRCWIDPGTEADWFVFPGDGNEGMSTSRINLRFKALLRRAGMYKSGLTTHQLRHACATHLIERGAEIRYVQELLGHSSIETTVRYTRNQVEELKKAYRTHHPRENQLYEEVDDIYMKRIEALERHIIEGRQKYLSKLKRRGYKGDVSLFTSLSPVQESVPHGV